MSKDKNSRLVNDKNLTETKEKKNNKMSHSFTSKKFRYGGYAAVVSVIFIAIIVVVNLVVSGLNITFDLTPNKMFTISSDKTDTVLQNLEEPIKIYALYETGNEDEFVTQILNDYKKTSGFISVQTMDPVLNPNFVETFKTSPDERIQVGSLIVVNENVPTRFRVISYSDVYAYNSYTQEQTFDAEQAITSAIDYVTKEELPTVYIVQGHSENDLSAGLTKQMGLQNYETQQVNLLTDEIDPAEKNILLINSPKRDLTEEEAAKVLEYMGLGGRALIFTDYNTPELINFNSVLQRYGLDMNNGIIIEGDTSHMMGYYPHVLIPIIGSHDISNNLVENDLYVVVPQAAAIVEREQKKSQVEVTPLLTTTDKAYLKTNPTSETIEMEEGDIPGPFNVAVAVQENNYDVNNNPITSKLVVASSSLIMDDSFISATGNLDFLMNGFNWLSDQQEGIAILAKDLMPETLMVDQTKALLYAGFFIILLPLIVIVYGISVWLRRRHL